jgi:hypothetical protein
MPFSCSCRTQSRMCAGRKDPRGRVPRCGKACSRSCDSIEARVFGSARWVATQLSPVVVSLLRAGAGGRRRPRSCLRPARHRRPPAPAQEADTQCMRSEHVVAWAVGSTTLASRFGASLEDQGPNVVLYRAGPQTARRAGSLRGHDHSRQSNSRPKSLRRPLCSGAAHCGGGRYEEP